MPTLDPRSDWPMLGGNVRRAGNEHIAAPTDSPHVAWRYNAGRGILSPLVANAGIVLTGTSNRVLTAISPDGRRYWMRRIDGAVTGGVVQAGQRVVGHSEERGGKLFALELATGKQVWRKQVGPSPQTPLVIGDTVFAATDQGNVVALRLLNGDVIWRTRVGSPATASVTPAGDALLVTTANDSIFSVERRNGQIVHRTKLPGGTVAAAAVHAQHAYVALHSGTVVILSLPELKEVARVTLEGQLLAAPVVDAEGTVYQLANTGAVYRIAGTSATQIATLGSPARASFTLVANGFVVGGTDGAVALFSRTGQRIWRTQLDDGVHAPVSVVPGGVYVPLVNGTVARLN